MNGSSRWFLVPVVFAVFLFLALTLRWLPAAIERFQAPYGQGQVLGGQINLAWKCVLRGLVVLILVVPVVLSGRTIRLREVFVLCGVTVAAEISVEYLITLLVGAKASKAVQLIATAVAFLGVLVLRQRKFGRHFVDAA